MYGQHQGSKKMDSLIPHKPEKVIHDIIQKNHFFPNNSRIPFMVYKQAIHFTDQSAEAIQAFLKQNHWINSWVDGIYNYDHYHSNTHEALIIIVGTCTVQIGGEDGKCYDIGIGDVVIFPAGVAHKNIGSSDDFKCIGAYPVDLDYDMKFGFADEHPKVDENIKKVALPKCDPVFGKNGLLFDYWK